ncbi:MAG TPA: NFACT RNA binding domain-containing protein, partial [Bacteroidota bacterium]|nr:NFACT RNA binding domain-containing protein [Bacteroidota bacterium]
LKGCLLSEAFTQNRNELILRFSPANRSGGIVPDEFVTVSCEPSVNFVHTANEFHRAKRNSLDLFGEFLGESVRSVHMHAADREIAIAFASGIRMMIQMYGSKANVLVVNQDDEVVDSFLRSRELKGTTLPAPTNRATLPDAPGFLQELRGLGELSIGVALKKALPRFGTTLLSELLHRAGISRGETLDRLSDEAIHRLFNEAETLVKELESPPEPRIYFEDGKASVFSPIDLHHCNGNEMKEFSSLSEAIRAYIGAEKHADRAEKDLDRIRRGLAKEHERVTRTLEKIEAEANSANRAAQYERMGELLKAHLHELHKGMSEAIVEETAGEAREPVSIPLDRNLTPAKNAERYFEKAKHSRSALAEKKKQKERLLRENDLLEHMLRKLDAIPPSGGFESFVDEYRDHLSAFGLIHTRHEKKAVEESVPFRVFRVSGEFTVWAGKSGENNDLLSTRYTKPKDLWFHARAVGGSHVVLKLGTGKGEVSKHAINEAAAIAAYYSKMKNSKLVPVSMCEGKYVRKPKGAPPGTVTIDREKVIFVEPRLPGV